MLTLWLRSTRSQTFLDFPSSVPPSLTTLGQHKAGEMIYCWLLPTVHRLTDRFCPGDMALYRLLRSDTPLAAVPPQHL